MSAQATWPAGDASTSARAEISRPEILLADADYRGTLAAVRSLGRAGIRVTVAFSDRLAPAVWSRHAARVLACPDIASSPERFLAWLLELGAREPGKVLYPTSDDVALLFALHREELARFYRFSLPSSDAVYTLLNKWRLHTTCKELGIDAPDAWLPNDEHDLSRFERDLVFPLVIKPQTQAFLAPHQKGRIVRGPSDLGPQYRDFRHATRHASMLLQIDPTAGSPLLQAFSEDAASHIYNLSGFIDASGTRFEVRASRKVLQWPRRLGTGLCFEEAPVDSKLAHDVKRLCTSVGYHGAFEVEFLESNERRLLIDFNPRFYGQMAFDIARGLDLPLYAYLAAVRAHEDLGHALERSRFESRMTGRAYCDRCELEIVLGLLQVAHRTTREERAAVHAWLKAHRDRMTDAALDDEDLRPGAVAALTSLLRRVAHPRSAWRSARGG